MNLLSALSEASSLLASVEGKLMGWGIGRRPFRNPRNPTAYSYWLREQTLETLEAEKQLYQKGFYKYESINTMENCRSKEGKQIHIDDIVVLPTGEEGIILAILEEDQVQVNPIGPGLPLMISPKELSVKYSFIEKILSLKSDEELQGILNKTRELAIEMGTKKTKATTSSSKVKEVEEDEESI